MSKQITTAGILMNVYNSRAMITDAFDNQPLVRMKNGDHWAVFKEDKEDQSIGIYYSNDQGFTWYYVWSGDLTQENLRDSFPNVNTQGSHISLQIFENDNLLIIWHGYKGAATNAYDMEPLIFNITDPLNIERVLPANFPTGIGIDADSTIHGTNNDKSSYVSYIRDGQLRVAAFRPTNIALSRTLNYTAQTGYSNIFGACAGSNGYVDHVCIQTVGAVNQIVHVRYIETKGMTAQSVISVSDGLNEITDPSIAHDRYGNLCVIWSERNTVGSDLDVYTSLSLDQGKTWSAPSKIIKSAAHSAYKDKIKGAYRGRSTIMGGHQGFIFSYVRSNEKDIPKTYIRVYLSNDGKEYTLSGERQVGTSITRAEDPVVGLRFFRLSGTTLMDLSYPGKVTIAIQIGEGNASNQDDIIPVRIGQESLSSSAYPTYDNYGNYELDEADEHTLRVTANILGSPSENIDYFAFGLIDEITIRYQDAFETLGTNTQLNRYDPILDSETNDESAYFAPIQYNCPLIFDPSTYQFPLQSSSVESHSQYIERDIRQVFIPPSFHLGRYYLVNEGNYFKRSVWTCFYDGNEYEISQVVPYFFNNQIAYYGANMYVIGPSNNPFNKRTLPSET